LLIDIDIKVKKTAFRSKNMITNFPIGGFALES